MKRLFYLFILFVFVLSCKNQAGEKSGNFVNPNGESELAVLMKSIFEDAMRMKGEIEQGKRPKVKVDYAEIHVAEATQPGKTTTPEFISFAAAYVEGMRALEQASIQSAPEIYTGIVNTCMACHDALCPGPRVKIKKLYLKDLELTAYTHYRHTEKDKSASIIKKAYIETFPVQ